MYQKRPDLEIKQNQPCIMIPGLLIPWAQIEEVVLDCLGEPEGRLQHRSLVLNYVSGRKRTFTGEQAHALRRYFASGEATARVPAGLAGGFAPPWDWDYTVERQMHESGRTAHYVVTFLTPQKEERRIHYNSTKFPFCGNIQELYLLVLDGASKSGP